MELKSKFKRFEKHNIWQIYIKEPDKNSENNKFFKRKQITLSICMAVDFLRKENMKNKDIDFLDFCEWFIKTSIEEL